MQIAIIALLAALVLSVLWLAVSLRRRVAATMKTEERDRFDAMKSELYSTLSSNSQLVSAQLANVTALLTEQLSTLNVQMQAHGSEINRQMDRTANLVAAVSTNLGELSKTSERIFEVGRDISGLHDILTAPKLRGGLGEFMLADLLGQCLPSSVYTLQYSFSTGSRVDAVVRLGGRLVPVDAKFPLENFKKLVSAESDQERALARRRFFSDCKKHMDAIASNYILPEEGTFDFALMYIPAENVYYETMLRDSAGGEDLAAYAFSRKVVPVSPNSFYAYLQTVLLGLKGLEVSEKAEEILAHIGALKKDFSQLGEDISILGRHLGNARAKYEDVQKKAERLSDRLGAPNSAQITPAAED